MKIRKKRMLQFLKQCVLLFIIPFFLYNCEKEENIVENEVPQNTFKKNYTLKKIKYKELAKDAAFLKPFTKLSNTFNNKSTDDKENRNELSILTDEIARIETANSITWTFELETKLKEASIFENLLVKKQDNEFNYYLISYQEENDTEDGKNSKQSLLYTLSEEDFNFDGLNSLAKDVFTVAGEEDGDGGGGGSAPCNGVWIPEYNHCDAGGDANGHSPQRQWNGRYCSGSPLIGYVIDFSHCSNYQPPAGPGNNNGTGTTGNNNGGTTGGGGSSNTNNNNSSGGTTITTPIQNIDGIEYRIAEVAANSLNRALGNQLSVAQLRWLSKDENFNLSVQLEGYLINSNATNKVREIINIVEGFSNTIIAAIERERMILEALNILEPEINSTQMIDYKEEFLRMAAFLEKRGESEAKQFGAFIKQFANGLNSSSNVLLIDVKKIYEIVRTETFNLKLRFQNEIFGTAISSFKPVIQVALIGVGGGLAVKILKALPPIYITGEISAIITRLTAIYLPVATATTSAAYKALLHAGKYGIHSYDQLVTKFESLGITRTSLTVQFHHLIEQRFIDRPGVKEWLGSSTGSWKSIVTSVVPGAGNEHNLLFTQPWRQAIAYGSGSGWTGANTNNATLEDIKQAARVIYQNYPEILEALGLN